jgi:hypothetical protein
MTIRLPQYLYDVVTKVTLDRDMTYSDFIRLAISAYLDKVPTSSYKSDNAMSYAKSPIQPMAKVDTAPVAKSIYGWD